MPTTGFLLCASCLTATAPAADTTGKVVRYTITVDAPVDSVWAAWTTEAGLRTFFAPFARIELRTFGRFDIHFSPEAEAGRRGAEGNVVLAVEPGRMLTTTWDAPPAYPTIRAQRTFLEIRLTPAGPATTRLTLTQSGFGSDAEWAKVHTYFTGAWTWVLAALQHRFEHGPLDWSSPPDLLPRMQAIGGTAAVEWARHQAGG